MGKTHLFTHLAVEGLPFGVAITIREVGQTIASTFVADAVAPEHEGSVPAFQAGDRILVGSPQIGWRLIVIGEQTEAVLSNTDEVLERPLEWLLADADGRMRTRLLAALARIGVRTIRGLLGKTEADILRIPNTGRKSVNLLNRLLGEKVGMSVRLGHVRIV